MLELNFRITTCDPDRSSPTVSGRIPGAHPLKNESFSNTLVVADRIFVTTQFPAAGVEVKMTNQDGEVTKLVDHRSHYNLDLQESSRPSRLLSIA